MSKILNYSLNIYFELEFFYQSNKLASTVDALAILWNLKHSLTDPLTRVGARIYYRISKTSGTGDTGVGCRLKDGEAVGVVHCTMFKAHNVAWIRGCLWAKVNKRRFIKKGYRGALSSAGALRSFYFWPKGPINGRNDPFRATDGKNRFYICHTKISAVLPVGTFRIDSWPAWPQIVLRRKPVFTHWRFRNYWAGGTTLPFWCNSLRRSTPAGPKGHAQAGQQSPMYWLWWCYRVYTLSDILYFSIITQSYWLQLNVGVSIWCNDQHWSMIMYDQQSFIATITTDHAWSVIKTSKRQFWAYILKVNNWQSLFASQVISSRIIKIHPVTRWVEPVSSRPIEIFSPKIDTDPGQ